MKSRGRWGWGCPHAAPSRGGGRARRPPQGRGRRRAACGRKGGAPATPRGGPHGEGKGGLGGVGRAGLRSKGAAAAIAESGTAWVVNESLSRVGSRIYTASPVVGSWGLSRQPPGCVLCCRLWV